MCPLFFWFFLFSFFNLLIFLPIFLLVFLLFLTHHIGVCVVWNLQPKLKHAIFQNRERFLAGEHAGQR